MTAIVSLRAKTPHTASLTVRAPRTASIDLPLPLRLGAASDSHAISDTAESNDELAEEQPIRVLIVEDEALVALDMAMILNAAGYHVMGTKPTGDLALSALAAAAADGIMPDLVLMDIALRGNMDGVETAQQVRNKHANVPVAFVTGQADPITRARAEATCPAGYLLKPFTPEQLVTFIKSVITGR